MSKTDSPKKLGRPTKYSEEYVKKLRDYVDNFKEMDLVTQEVASQGKTVAVTTLKSRGIPTVEEFILETDICKETFYTWTKLHPDFLDAFRKLKAKQKVLLLRGGLNGDYNSGFAKFAAINCTDMKDSSHVEQTNKNIEIKIDDDDAGL